MCTWSPRQPWLQPRLASHRHQQKEEQNEQGARNRIGRQSANRKEVKEAKVKERRMAVAKERI
eukprot:2910280-Karenia_brevis.AAC.1